MVFVPVVFVVAPALLVVPFYRAARASKIGRRGFSQGVNLGRWQCLGSRFVRIASFVLLLLLLLLLLLVLVLPLLLVLYLFSSLSFRSTVLVLLVYPPLPLRTQAL